MVPKEKKGDACVRACVRVKREWKHVQLED